MLERERQKMEYLQQEVNTLSAGRLAPKLRPSSIPMNAES